MALSDFYDFAPLIAQMRQGGQGMTGGMGTPQNAWAGQQFVMPPVTGPAQRPQLPPYAGTAMAQPGAPAPGNLFGALAGGGRPGGRPGGMGGFDPKNPFGLIRGLMG